MPNWAIQIIRDILRGGGGDKEEHQKIVEWAQTARLSIKKYV